jgi:manganese-dependent ADP-ribose/CDP-alcohol diphosphatase
MNILILSIFAAKLLFNMPFNNEKASLCEIRLIEKPLFTFGILADVQYADCEPAGTRFYRSSLSKLRDALSAFKSDSADFIINLGDIIDRDYVSYKAVLGLIDSSGLKTFHVTGNHDYSVEPGLKSSLPVLFPSPGGYYSSVRNNFRFIFLNGNEISEYSSTDANAIRYAKEYILMLKNNGESNAIEWNGGIGPEQLKWLKGQLDEAKLKNEKVFIVSHFPVFPVNVHNLLDYKDILPLLEKYQNIVGWLNGHNHSGNYGELNNVHFITFSGMVETEKQNSYALVRVYKNKTIITGAGREKSRILIY